MLKFFREIYDKTLSIDGSSDGLIHLKRRVLTCYISKNVLQYKSKIHIPLVFTKTKLNPSRLQVGKYAYRLYTYVIYVILRCTS